MSLFRPEVAALKAYAMPDESSVVKVNQNEVPWDWPPELKEEAVRRVAGVAFNRYPPFDEKTLTTALAARWGLRPESVIVGNGSNELLQALFLSALGPGRKVLMPSPTFSLYRQLALLTGAPVSEVPLKDGLTYKSEALLKAVRREKPALVLLCSPNNPTGASYPVEALADLTRRASFAAFSEPGLARLAGEGSVGMALRHVAAGTTASVGVTLGPDGFLWLEAGRERREPAPEVHAVDTLAAGDVWHGAFTLMLGEGRPVAAAARFANTAAALKCTRFGGRAGAPSRAEVEAQLADAG